MLENSKVHYIPAKPPNRDKRVGIYCRVSTNSADQLKSLSTQVSHLKQVSVATPTDFVTRGRGETAEKVIFLGSV